MTDLEIEKLHKALNNLDPEDVAHWTKAGKPNLNVVSEYCGFRVTRHMVDQAAPLASGIRFPKEPDPVSTTGDDPHETQPWNL